MAHEQYVHEGIRDSSARKKGDTATLMAAVTVKKKDAATPIDVTTKTNQDAATLVVAAPTQKKDDAPRLSLAASTLWNATALSVKDAAAWEAVPTEEDDDHCDQLPASELLGKRDKASGLQYISPKRAKRDGWPLMCSYEVVQQMNHRMLCARANLIVFRMQNSFVCCDPSMPRSSNRRAMIW